MNGITNAVIEESDKTGSDDPQTVTPAETRISGETALVERTKARKPGPKSLAGRQKSARNAFQSGFFSKGLLPWEDAKYQELQWNGLVRYWGAYDPARVGLLRTYEFAMIQQERMMVIERDKIAGAMQSIDIAHEFARRAGLSTTTCENLPGWFFKTDDDGEKDRATLVLKIHEQALHLKKNFNDQLAGRVEHEYPNLYRHVMKNQNSNRSFLISLGQQYKQQTSVLNLAVLINNLQERYHYHLIWAEDAERHQLIVNGLRAELIERIIDVDKSYARAASLQNRMLKAFSGMASMDQHEQQWCQTPELEKDSV